MVSYVARDGNLLCDGDHDLSLLLDGEFPIQLANFSIGIAVRLNDWRPRRPLWSQEEMTRLLDGRARIVQKLLVRGAADRVADDGELVVGHAEHPTHELRRAHEACRHHAKCRHSLPFRHDCVVQTAR